MEEQMQLQNALEESKKDNPNPDVMTYEEMLELGDKMGKVLRGFKTDQIERIPRRRITCVSDPHGNALR